MKEPSETIHVLLIEGERECSKVWSGPSTPHATYTAQNPRTREDSPSPPPISPSPTPDPSTPGSFDEPAHSSKYIQTSPTARTRSVMKCSLPPHETLEFSTFEEFEIHYSKVHAYRCSECRSNFPTEHFLGLHISENHDPLSEARRAREEKTVRLSDCKGD